MTSFARTAFAHVRIPHLDLPFTADDARRFFRDRMPPLPKGLTSADRCDRAAWLLGAAKVLSEIRPDDVRNFPKQIDPRRVAIILLEKLIRGCNFDQPAITPIQRRKIAEEQGWHCHYGDRGQLRKSEYSPGFIWHIDHKWPRARGGSDHPVNLVASCASHNRRKGTRFYTGFRIDLLLDSDLAKCGN